MNCIFFARPPPTSVQLPSRDSSAQRPQEEVIRGGKLRAKQVAPIPARRKSGAEAAKNAPHPCFSNTSHFNPRSPCGERRKAQFGDVVIEFQPTLPVRGATVHHLVDGCLMEISTHAPRAGSDETRETARLEHLISTHAPRAGSDRLAVGLVADQDISTHAPRAGSDVPISSGFAASQLFQPTLPVRGATARVPALRRHQAHFNPRSPCGERPFLRYSANLSKRFQPTLPVRGATGTSSSPTRPSLNFNPRSPCGERRAGAALRARFTKFQPTLPVRGATAPEVSWITRST